MRAQPHDPAGICQPPLLFLRLSTVMQVTGLGRSTIYRMIAGDKFPRQVRIGDRAVAWRQSDVVDWSETRTQPQ